MSFFIRKGGGGLPLGKKRKAAPEKKVAKKARKAKEDEEIDSDGSDIEVRDDAGYESEEDVETAEEKRLRLAKVYLAEVEEELKQRRGVVDDADVEERDRKAFVSLMLSSCRICTGRANLLQQVSCRICWAAQRKSLTAGQLHTGNLCFNTHL